jgi:hypothetical protein
MVPLKFMKGNMKQKHTWEPTDEFWKMAGSGANKAFLRPSGLPALPPMMKLRASSGTWLSADGAGNGGVTKGRGEEQAEHRNGCYLRISPKPVGSIFRFRQIPAVF